MRLFIAIDLDERIRASAWEAVQPLRKEPVDVKWVEQENLHLTLKFLGEVGEAQVKEIEGKVAEVVQGHASFPITLGGLGYYGDSHHPRSLWIGVKENEEKILKLMADLDAALDYVNENPREPSAHLTIGRVRSGRNQELLLEKLRELKDVKVGEMDVKMIALKRSVLGEKGPQYSDMKVFPLGRNNVKMA